MSNMSPNAIKTCFLVLSQDLRQAERRTLTGWREIDCDKELEDEGLLGTGGFGTVRLAKWNNTLVAVKYLTRASPKRDLVHDLRREVAVHLKLRFDFIVLLYGACTVGHNLCLVMERAPGGLQSFKWFVSRNRKGDLGLSSM